MARGQNQKTIMYKKESDVVLFLDLVYYSLLEHYPRYVFLNFPTRSVREPCHCQDWVCGGVTRCGVRGPWRPTEQVRVCVASFGRSER